MSSEFPWEQEALDFIYSHFPDRENYRAWANFEFISGGPHPTANEIDLLVACPQGLFLIEIKSHPGNLTGDRRDWVFYDGSKRWTMENPYFLADKKCKRLKSLLGNHSAFKKSKLQVPFIEPLIFLSNETLVNNLREDARHGVCLRDREKSDSSAARQGIMAAIMRREGTGLRELPHPVLSLPQIKAVSKSLEQLGIRPSKTRNTVGDFVLGDLVSEHPEGLYQDFQATHQSHEGLTRLARRYLIPSSATADERAIVEEAARREVSIATSLQHEGVLQADPPTQAETGPVLFFRHPAGAQRLDHFLLERGETLGIDTRLDLLRQIAETVAYVHRKHLVHRSLSPRSILVSPAEEGDRYRIHIGDWQTGSAFGEDSRTPLVSRFTGSIHADQLLEDSTRVYIAPEILLHAVPPEPEQDVFSLGAIAWLIFSGQPPAESSLKLQQKLSASLGGLDISGQLDAPPAALAELIRTATHGSASDRGSVQDFLVGLDFIEEELTAPDLDIIANPLEAKKDDLLEHGLTMIRRLGSGSVSVALQVKSEREGEFSEPFVLKIARSSEHNSRLRDEFHLLQKINRDVDSRHIVTAHELLDFGELTGFTMDLAGEKTVASLIQTDGPIENTLLERYGDDLLTIVRDLHEREGYAHRDIKPANMGIRSTRSSNRLCLFDFSLAQASPDEINLGTPTYLDPFIAEREQPRWDVSSELFSVAVTLYEMTTGVLPKWGDGKSAPAAVPGEATLHAEFFDPRFREAFLPFFEKALRRDFRQRFDNPEEMLKAWRKIFIGATEPRPTTRHRGDEATAAEAPPAKKRPGRPKKDSTVEEKPTLAEFTFDLPATLRPDTQLASLAISARLESALDRLDLITVEDFLSFPINKIKYLPGVGNKTRRELLALARALRAQLPDFEFRPGKKAKILPGAKAPAPGQPENIDQLALTAATHAVPTGRKAEATLIQHYLGWTRPENLLVETDSDIPAWLSQADLATAADVTRQRVGQALTLARKKWSSHPSLRPFCDDIHAILTNGGGVYERDELIRALLAARGSDHSPEKALQHAATALRAALEAERSRSDSRFVEYRQGETILIATDPALKAYAIDLGKCADRLAAATQLAGPSTALTRLRGIPLPGDLPGGHIPLTDERLCDLAVATSHTAALSNRREIYPIGLDPRRALMLAQVATLGDEFTVADVEKRVRLRLPHAAPLPTDPATLEALFQELGLPLRWEKSARHGLGAFTRPQPAERPTITQNGATSAPVTLAPSAATRTSYLSQRSPDIPPEHRQGFELDRSLQDALAHGRYLVLGVPPGTGSESARRLAAHFGPDRFTLINGDALILEELKTQAASLGADWNVVLQADAAAPDSPDWKNLQQLVTRSLPGVRKKLSQPDRTIVLYHPGLLARYHQLHLIEELATEVGRPGGPAGLWIIIPDSHSQSLPTLNQQAIPLLNPAAHHRLSSDFLEGRHRR